MNQLESLLEAVHNAPEDWALYLVAADCAEEEGSDIMARGLRWQAENEKRPFCPFLHSKAYWYNTHRTWGLENDSASDLADNYFRRLRGCECKQGVRKMYQSIREAEEALWDMLEEMLGG